VARAVRHGGVQSRGAQPEHCGPRRRPRRPGAAVARHEDGERRAAARVDGTRGDRRLRLALDPPSLAGAIITVSYLIRAFFLVLFIYFLPSSVWRDEFVIDLVLKA
jgi:hypothetical protein